MPLILEAETDGSLWVQGYPDLQSHCEVPILKNKQTTKLPESVPSSHPLSLCVAATCLYSLSYLTCLLEPNFCLPRKSPYNLIYKIPLTGLINVNKSNTMLRKLFVKETSDQHIPLPFHQVSLGSLNSRVPKLPV